MYELAGGTRWRMTARGPSGARRAPAAPRQGRPQLLRSRRFGPAFAFVENSPLLVRRGLEVVLSDLAEMGYDATWCVLGADTSDTPLDVTASGCWGNISRTMAGWRSKESLLRTTYGAARKSLPCQMLTVLGLWPTVTLVETLMGWPTGWTACQPLATDKFLQWRRSPSGF